MFKIYLPKICYFFSSWNYIKLTIKKRIILIYLNLCLSKENEQLRVILKAVNKCLVYFLLRFVIINYLNLRNY